MCYILDDGTACSDEVVFEEGGGCVNPVHQWFDSIYIQYQKKLLVLAIRMVGDSQLAEDIVQSVFLTLLTNYDRLMTHPNIWGWLVITLKNQIMNEMQKAFHSREMELKSSCEPATEDPFEPDFLEAMPPGLSDAERELLYLHFEVGLRYEEIASKLGCSPEACRMRLLRAKKHCQTLMKNFPE